MTSGAKIALGVAIAAAVAAGGYHGFKNGKEAATQTQEPTATSTTTVSTTTSSTPPVSAGFGKIGFSQLAQGKGTYKCTIASATKDGQVTGTIYTSNGMIRGEASLPSTAGTISASFIIKEGFVYYWNSAMPQGQGIKLAYDAAAYKQGDFSQFDQMGDYTCQTWTVEPARFVLPTNITFQAVSQ